MTTTDTTRNATLDDLATLLRDQHARKVDVVAPATHIGAAHGQLRIANTAPQLGDDGVTLTDGLYTPTKVCDEGIAAKLDIPGGYLRRMRDERPDLYDANVNGWLHGRKTRTRLVNGEQQVIAEGSPTDQRSFLVRCFRPDDEDGTGIARAFLSDQYKLIDNLDALSAALDGINHSGVGVEIDGCDLTDRRMMIRIKAPQVEALAPDLLAGYRSPFTGEQGTDNPVVHAGLQISNSETGGGAFTIVPRLVIQVCNNGMVITKDAVRAVHLGGKLEPGVIRWSEETQEKQLDLIRSKAADAVASFLDVDYMQKVIRDTEAKAGKPVENVDEVKTLAKRLQYTQEQTDGILAHFIQSGQMTRGGVMAATTSYAQTVTDGDEAADLEDKALRVLDVTS